MAIRVLMTQDFKNNVPAELRRQLIDTFKEYKSTGVLPKDWGRDVAYDLIASIAATGLRHIHIKDKTSKHWNFRTLQFNKTSNTALVYCQGYFDKDVYLFIAFSANAHEMASNSLYLMALGDIADVFRSKF